MLGENLRLGEPDAIFFSLSSHKEERVGESRPFWLGTPLSGSLPARSSRGEREPGFDRQFVISVSSMLGAILAFAFFLATAVMLFLVAYRKFRGAATMLRFC